MQKKPTGSSQYGRSLRKYELVREHLNASPGGKLSPPQAVTDEECGRQRLMTRNEKTYSEVAYCVQPVSRYVMVC